MTTESDGLGESFDAAQRALATAAWRGLELLARRREQLARQEEARQLQLAEEQRRYGTALQTLSDAARHDVVQDRRPFEHKKAPQERENDRRAGFDRNAAEHMESFIEQHRANLLDVEQKLKTGALSPAEGQQVLQGVRDSIERYDRQSEAAIRDEQAWRSAWDRVAGQHRRYGERIFVDELQQQAAKAVAAASESSVEKQAAQRDKADEKDAQKVRNIGEELVVEAVESAGAATDPASAIDMASDGARDESYAHDSWESRLQRAAQLDDKLWSVDAKRSALLVDLAHSSPAALDSATSPAPEHDAIVHANRRSRRRAQPSPRVEK